MTRKLKFALCILLAAAAVSLTPLAKADEWNKRTIMTFSGPVEIPGKVLPAGTYVFKLADSQSDRTIVQVFTGDEKQIVATILAVPNYRQETPDKTLVTFEERASGSPEAVHSWFYPGDNYGIEFVYPKAAQPVRTFEKPSLVAAAPAPAPEPEPVIETPAPELAKAEAPAPVEIREEVPPAIELTAPEPAPAPVPEPELPNTAANFLMYPAFGVAFLGAGFVALRTSGKRS